MQYVGDTCTSFPVRRHQEKRAHQEGLLTLVRHSYTADQIASLLTISRELRQ